MIKKRNKIKEINRFNVDKFQINFIPFILAIKISPLQKKTKNFYKLRPKRNRDGKNSPRRHHQKKSSPRS